MTRTLCAIFILLATLSACTTPQGSATPEPSGTPAATARATTAASTPTRRPATLPANTPVPAPTATPEPPAERGTLVVFPSTDGVRLRGAFYAPPGEGPYKTVILIHGAGTDRHVWDAFIPVLQGAGYAVLAYDVRGTGKSDPIAPDSATPDSLVFDVTGALNWLATRPEVDAGRIAVMGASLGANVAYAANGGTTRIRTAVAISPIDTGGALLGTDTPGFVSRDAMLVSDEAGLPLAQALFDQTRAPRNLHTAPAGVRAQGVDLLAIPEVVTEILNWLTEQL